MTPDMELGRSRREALFRRLAVGIVAIYLALVIPDWGTRFLGIGLDGSWIATLQHFANSGLQFGKDIVYTYGPLGYLATPPGDPDVFWPQLAWGLFQTLVLALAFARLVPPRAGAWSLLAAGVLCLLVSLSSVDAHLYAILLLAVTAGKATARPRATEILLVLALSVCGLTKLTLLIVGAAAVAAAAGLTWVDFRRLGWLPALFVGSVLALWLAAGQALASWPPFLRRGLEMTSGYTESMSYAGPHPEAVAIVVLYLLVLASWRARTGGGWTARTWILVLATSFVFFSAFKLGFVRHHSIRSLATWQILIAVAALGATAPIEDREGGRRWPRAGHLAAGLCILGLALPLNLHFPETPLQPLTVAPRKARRAPGKILELLRDPGRPRKHFERRQEAIRAEYPLPPLTGSVDLYGDQSGILIAHGLDYTPRPVFQSFATYTRALTRLNGDFYRGPAAPGTVVARPLGFQGVPAGFQDAETLLEIYRSYRLTANLPTGLILSRAPGSHELTFGPTKNVSARIGEWIPVQGFDSLAGIWAEIEVPRTLLGRLGDFVYKLPELVMTLRFEIGPDISFRFSPRGGSGLLLSPVIMNHLELREVITGGLGGAPPSRRPTALRVAHRDGGGDWAREGVVIRWRELID